MSWTASSFQPMQMQTPQAAPVHRERCPDPRRSTSSTHSSCACRAEPNAYTYASLIKVTSEHGRMDLAEQLFAQLYPEVSAAMQHTHTGSPASHQAPDAMLPPLASDTTWSSTPAQSPASGAALWQLSPFQQSSRASCVDLQAHQTVSLPTSASQQSLTEQLSALGFYGALPAAMAESVLASRHSMEVAAMRLPDGLPGQAGLAEPVSADSDASSDFALSPSHLAVSGLHSAVPSTPRRLVVSRPQAISSVLAQPMGSAIIITAMMAAYERCRSWREVSLVPPLLIHPPEHVPGVALVLQQLFLCICTAAMGHFYWKPAHGALSCQRCAGHPLAAAHQALRCGSHHRSGQHHDHGAGEAGRC